MRPVSEIFLASKPMQSSSEATATSGNSKTTKTKDTYIKRISRYELELAYMSDPVVFNGINKITQMIMSGEYKIEAKNKSVEKYFNEFVLTLGLRGSGTSWDELLESIYKNTLTYGCSFVENIFNKRKNRVVDWDIIDAKKIDYAKDSCNNIVVDKNNNVIGYFQLLNYSSASISGAIKVNNDVDTVLPPTVQRPMNYPDSIYLPKDQVAQIKFSNIGDGFYPIGLVEPIYKTTVQKMNIQESYASSVYRYANPILKAKLGDLSHQPTPNLLTSTLNTLKNLSSRNEIAVPYYYDIDYLQPKTIEKIRENLDYFIEQQVAGLGVTYTIATGGSDSANTASLGNQSNILSLTLKQIIKSVVSYIEKEMFAVVSKYEGFDEVPKLIWNIDTGDELNDKASRVMKYAQAGMLTYSKEVENIIRQTEGLAKLK